MVLSEILPEFCILKMQDFCFYGKKDLVGNRNLG